MDSLKFACPARILATVTVCPPKARLAATILLAVGTPSWVFAAEVDFNREVRPILSNHCIACHGPDEEERKANVRFDTREGALEALVPGDPGKSELFHRVTTDDEGDLMPPPEKGKRLSKKEVATLEKWIQQGAQFERHWSYAKPTRPEVPRSATSAWGHNEIDAFVLAQLEEKGVEPSPEADRWALARRVSIDLTGLPPTFEESKAFVEDPSPQAYEHFVDALLAKPAYGERWARVWLDLARYADSAGYADDPPRTIWAYRDYVIQSLNENKPFDQFTVEQIAGDLLPEPVEEQLVATAFHRNTLTNSEGGTDDEEFRSAAVVDRVNTTLQTWMGTTMACAQCHTHKYDPITHHEYFGVYAIFNQSEDSDKKDERPTLPILTDEDRAERADLEKTIAEIETALAAPSPQTLQGLKNWERKTRQRLAGADPWTVLEPVTMKASSGASIQAQPDDSLVISGKEAETERYVLETRSTVKLITAVRLETLAGENGTGPGRKGNFVLSEIRVASGAPSSPKRGRYVRLELPGKGKFLHVAEVEAFDESGANVAMKGKATQSTTGFGGEAGFANDGLKDKQFSHTAAGDEKAFWEVDLLAGHDLDKLVIWNRADGNVAGRLDGVTVSLLAEDRSVVWSQTIAKTSAKDNSLNLRGRTAGRFIRASSTYDQPKFEVGKAIDGDVQGGFGWAVGGAHDQSHAAVFELAEPIPGDQLQWVLHQNYQNHALRQFRISVTGDQGDHSVLPYSIAAILEVDADTRTEQQQAALLAHYLPQDPTTRAARKRLAILQKKLANLKPTTTVPVLRELPPESHRKTHVHVRGSHLMLGDEVKASLPKAWNPSPSETPNRLDLAHWLMDPENPLTARVAVNRHWEQLFGIGLVATSEEFGSQGEMPSHPELLDWLAVEFMESGWDLKHLLRLLVTSATYRQVSKIETWQAEEDPYNRLLARGPRVRLSAEMIRDQVLFSSGLLSPKMFGPPARPPRPKLGLKAAFGGTTDWEDSTGEDRWRRGVYTEWRRSMPYPSMAAFDAPNREVCTVKRSSTNTPLQALVTLNDPVFFETAQALGRRAVMEMPDADAPQIAARMIEHALVRPARPGEAKRLAQLHADALAKLAGEPDNEQAALSLATDPLGPLPEDMDLHEMAAWSIVANIILNLDEIFQKR